MAKELDSSSVSSVGRCVTIGILSLLSWTESSSDGGLAATHQTILWPNHSDVVNSLPLEVPLYWNRHLQLRIDIVKFLVKSSCKVARNLMVSILN